MVFSRLATVGLGNEKPLGHKGTRGGREHRYAVLAYVRRRLVEAKSFFMGTGHRDGSHAPCQA